MKWSKKEVKWGQTSFEGRNLGLRKYDDLVKRPVEEEIDNKRCPFYKNMLTIRQTKKEINVDKFDVSM